MDDGKLFLRAREIRPTQKVTVHRMEYCEGPAAVYPIHRIRTGIVVILNDVLASRPHHQRVVSLNSIIFNADNDGWDQGGGGSRAKARVTLRLGRTLSTDAIFPQPVKVPTQVIGSMKCFER
ncbi:hypothetical protein MVEN_02399700 [Mycena venus]|uniref:Uncharacterized protein n=1 Tax=Mycena venus TaxID=2733690 RepID=A0A8H7CEW0_9AGAR|nr:hypothetical protein MVEN_02399700 [Mycena venus]